MTPAAARRDTLDRLLRHARARGWRAAIEQECAARTQLLRYATDPREADCLHLLADVTPRRALFLGNALAMLPFALAQTFERVVVSDWNPSRLAFACHRTREDGVENVTCVPAATVDDVARRDGRFDAVVLGEECPDATFALPFRDPSTPWPLSSLVADGGCLMYGVRFRLIEPVAMRLARPWRTRGPAFYSSHARLLAAAMFTPVAVYWRRPDTRPYQVYIPLDRPSITGYWLQHAPRPRGVRGRLGGAMTAAASRSGLLLRVVDNFLMIARRR